jgi:hypothetical protein
VAAGKAARLLTEGRVAITFADAEGNLRALVEGDSGVWLVQRRADGMWRCGCLSWCYRRKCAHVDAVHLVAP